MHHILLIPTASLIHLYSQYNRPPLRDRSEKRSEKRFGKNCEMGLRGGIAESNMVLGKLAFLKGDFEKAKALAEEALEIATDIGNKRIARSTRDEISAMVALLEEDRQTSWQGKACTHSGGW
jgi:hypothetical protein